MFKKPAINCKDNKNDFYQQKPLNGEPQTSPQQNLRSSRHLARVFTCVVAYTHLFSPPPAPDSVPGTGPGPQTKLLSVRTWTLFDSPHGSPNAASAETYTRCLLWLKKDCSRSTGKRKKGLPRDSSGSNAGPAGVDYRHILQENSG